MKKSKFLLPITLFLIGAIISGFLVAFVMTQATHKIAEGDSFLYTGKLSQALKSYELAQKFWPLLYRNAQLNQKIQQIKEAKVKIEKAPALTAFFKNDTSVIEIQALAQEIKNMTDVREVKYISKEDAFKIYAKLNKDNPLILEMVTPDMLPASVEIYLSDPLIKEKLSQVLKTKGIVEEVVKWPSN